MNLQETLRALADGKCVKDKEGNIRRISADDKYEIWGETTKSWESASFVSTPPCDVVPDPSVNEPYFLGNKKIDKLLRNNHIIKYSKTPSETGISFVLIDEDLFYFDGRYGWKLDSSPHEKRSGDFFYYAHTEGACYPMPNEYPARKWARFDMPSSPKPEEPKYLLGDKKLDKLLRDENAIKAIGPFSVEHYRYCGGLHRRDPVIGTWKVASDPWGKVDGVKYFAFCDNYLDPTKITDWQPIPSDDDEYVDMKEIQRISRGWLNSCSCCGCETVRQSFIGKKVRTYDDVKVLLDHGFCIKRGTGITNIYRKKENELQYWYSHRKAWDNFDDDYLPEGPWVVVEEPKGEEKEEKKGYKFATSGAPISSPASFAQTPDEKYAEGRAAILLKWGQRWEAVDHCIGVEVAALNRKICKEEVMEELKKKGIIK